MKLKLIFFIFFRLVLIGVGDILNLERNFFRIFNLKLRLMDFEWFKVVFVIVDFWILILIGCLFFSRYCNLLW